MSKVDNVIKVVDISLDNALRGQANIESWIHWIKSFSTGEIRCLMNNLGKYCDTYLEVGSFQGGTLCSSICENKKLKAYAIDNFSEFKEEI